MGKKETAPLETNTQAAAHRHKHKSNKQVTICNWIKFSFHEKCYCHEKNERYFKQKRLFIAAAMCWAVKNKQMHEKCSFRQNIETIERHEINTAFFRRELCFPFSKFTGIISVFIEILALWTAALFTVKMLLSHENIASEHAVLFKESQFSATKHCK